MAWDNLHMTTTPDSIPLRPDEATADEVAAFLAGRTPFDIDPCRFAGGDVPGYPGRPHICTRRGGLPLPAGETCWWEARAQITDEAAAERAADALATADACAVDDLETVAADLAALSADIGDGDAAHRVGELASLVARLAGLLAYGR